MLLSLDQELADLSLPLAFSPYPYFLFQKVSLEIFRRTRPMTMSSVVIADNCNASAITHKNLEQEPTNFQTITHEEEKVALILYPAGGFAIWNMFQ